MKDQSMFSDKERGKSKQKEEKVQIQICKYLRLQYPNVIFTCDLASGMKLPIHIAAKNKSMRSSRGLPDLFIAHVKFKKEKYKLGSTRVNYPLNEIEYTGLFIEIKTEKNRLKNGGIAKTEHHSEQEAILKQLRQQGYKAEFSCGFDEAKKLIDDYLS